MEYEIKIDLPVIKFDRLTQEQKEEMYHRLHNQIDNIIIDYFPPRSVKPGQTDIAMITCSPPPGTALDELKRFTESAIRRTGISDWMYAYELQASGNPHSHIVIRADNLKYHKAEINRWNKKKKWNIDFQYRTKEPTDWIKAKTYITKEVLPTSSTVIWRVQNQLNNLYTLTAQPVAI